MPKLHAAAKSHLAALIKAGKFDAKADWSFEAADGNALLGKDGKDWARYGSVHLGEDTAAKDNTKAHWKYPAAKADGDSETVYRSGLIAAKERAAQQGDQAIEDAAGELVDLIDDKTGKGEKTDKDKDGDKESRAALAAEAPRAAAVAEFAALAGGSILALDLECLALSRHAGPLAAAPARGRGVQSRGGVAVIPVVGPLAPRSFSSWFFGAVAGMDALRAMIAEAVEDAGVETIVLDIDSPGGTVDGTPETAAAVRAAAGQKRVVAVANTLMASAAYWIGSQATEVVVSPSARMGSIGVLRMHQDVSKALAAAGIGVTVVSSPKGGYKAELSPFQALSPEALAAMQSDTDEAYATFVRDVAAGRRATQTRVRDDFGRGRVLSAAAAVSAGMADRVGTLESVIGNLTGGTGRRPARRSALAFL